MPKHRGPGKMRYFNLAPNEGLTTCRHALFMKLTKRTIVPECTNQRDHGSLYCVRHQTH